MVQSMYNQGCGALVMLLSMKAWLNVRYLLKPTLWVSGQCWKNYTYHTIISYISEKDNMRR
jgi:hypothetical protein